MPQVKDLRLDIDDSSMWHNCQIKSKRNLWKFTKIRSSIIGRDRHKQNHFRNCQTMKNSKKKLQIIIKTWRVFLDLRSNLILNRWNSTQLYSKSKLFMSHKRYFSILKPFKQWHYFALSNLSREASRKHLR
jgi:hypothetical protein